MLLEYQLDGIKIVDFWLIAKFLATPDNYDSPSKKVSNKQKFPDVPVLFS